MKTEHWNAFNKEQHQKLNEAFIKGLPLMPLMNSELSPLNMEYMIRAYELYDIDLSLVNNPKANPQNILPVAGLIVDGITNKDILDRLLICKHTGISYICKVIGYDKTVPVEYLETLSTQALMNIAYGDTQLFKQAKECGLDVEVLFKDFTHEQIDAVLIYTKAIRNKK